MISCIPWGKTPLGEAVHCYALRDANGYGGDFLDYGCIIRSLYVPDRQGRITDVCLGYDSLEQYINQKDYMGAVLGRHANRIAQASFRLNGHTYRKTISIHRTMSVCQSKGNHSWVSVLSMTGSTIFFASSSHTLSLWNFSRLSYIVLQFRLGFSTMNYISSVLALV